MTDVENLYEEYRALLKNVADVKYAAAVLQWDQETYLPPKGNAIRGQQIATLSEIAHEMFTVEKTGRLFESLLASNGLTDLQRRNVELSLYDFNKSKKLPASFVRKMSEAVNRSFHAWIQARKENSFVIFQSPLQEVIELKKREADLLGYAGHPYDALMNDYDKGLTVEIADKLFHSLKPRLSALLSTIQQQKQKDSSFLNRHFDKDKQWSFGLELLKKMHYDFEAGRQDISEHPFTTSFNSKDVRITTRIDENDFSNMTWSCLHEGGHALYEQGLPDTEYGLPLGEYCSLSIHESQSRLWENLVGRSLSYWKFHYPRLNAVFPEQLKDVSLEQFYHGINKVSPSLIRTEADELTYHFHVMIRYEIEKKLISGELKAADIPTAWGQYYREYLNVEVPDDKRGCLQDVHWSHGSFGYFATYSIGSLYAAQFFAAIRKQHAGIEIKMETGDTSGILAWLQQHIYPFGRYYNSEELCKRATGESLNSQYFIDYATAKFSDIYKKTDL